MGTAAMGTAAIGTVLREALRAGAGLRRALPAAFARRFWAEFLFMERHYSIQFRAESKDLHAMDGFRGAVGLPVINAVESDYYGTSLQ
jgi:hypothetical protein